MLHSTVLLLVVQQQQILRLLLLPLMPLRRTPLPTYCAWQTLLSLPRILLQQAAARVGQA